MASALFFAAPFILNHLDCTHGGFSYCFVTPITYTADLLFGETMSQIKQIICINWGTKYGPRYINRLYGMVARNITPPFRFVCFCDNNEGIRDEVECQPLPGLSFDLPVTQKGIWPKSQLWNEKLGDLSGPVLFLDLDLIVTSSLDSFFEYGDPEDVILAHNPSNPLERLGQTSVYRFPVGKLKPMLDKFAASPQSIAEEYKYEQRFVTQNAPDGIKLWPKPWVSHFRRNCRRTFPLNYFLPPKLGKKARIVIFPGDLHPDDAIEGFYYQDVQIKRTPCEHIMAGIKGDRKSGLLKHLRHYILPTKWVEKYWQE